MKLVKEYINEKFKEDSDPISDMDIGIAYRFKKFIKDKKHLVSEKDIKEFNYGSLYGYDALLASLASEEDTDTTDFVRYILETKNVDPSKNESLALRWAAARGRLKMLKLLLQYGANIDNMWERSSALSCAISFYQQHIIEYLLEVGAKIKGSDVHEAEQKFGTNSDIFRKIEEKYFKELEQNK